MLSAKKLLEVVNSGETLTQEELFPLFARASYLVYDCVRLLIRENFYVQLKIVDLGAEVAANLDRNKAIYRRPIDFVEDEVKDVQVDSEEREHDFLSSCMDLQLALLRGDIMKQLDLIISLPLTRMVLEQIVVAWLDQCREYKDLSYKSAIAFTSGDVDSSISVDADLFSMEQNAYLDPETAYGVVSYVATRVSALRAIYDRIFNAYSRVIWKLARTQAVSDDHALECMQNGSFGLMRATSSYDHTSNARFVGHARWWIRQSMLFYLKENSNIIKISSNTWQHYAKLESIRSRVESKNGPADIDAISNASGYSKSHVSSIYEMVRTSQVKSLDYPLKTEGGSTILTVVESAAEEATDHLDYDVADSVKLLLENLPETLRNLVCLHYGLTEYVVQDLDLSLIEDERNRQISKT